MAVKKEPAKKSVGKINKNQIKVKTAPKKEVRKEISADDEQAKKTAANLNLVRGMRDIIPPQGEIWRRIVRNAESIASAYGFQYIETPIVEALSLFVRSVGRGTDVVDKEMYAFEDRDGGKLCLRPEATASVARAYVMHGLQTLPQPVKVWYEGPMFRYDRPQAGRYREFHQFGCETLGDKSPVVDAELICVAYNLLNDLGLKTIVHINSIGTAEDREQYVVELSGYLRTKRAYLCEECKKRMSKNTLRVLDCKNEQCRSVIVEAPQIIDWLSEESKNFFMKVLEYLDELAIPYVLTSTLVRGLDYYTHTVFEFYPEDAEEKSQNALGGGGRYDALVELLGGQSTPAAGFSIGLERVLSAMTERTDKKEMAVAGKPKVAIFFAQLGEQARRRSLFLIEELRRDGIVVQHNLAKSSLKAQMEIANRDNATHTLILGQKEVQDGTIILRNMESGIQEIIDQKKIRQNARRLLETQ
ncbi:MAG: histidine--tRNA ligase [Patescibacteria group bacterium]